LITGFVAYSLYQGSKPAKMVFENQTLSISGMYSQTISVLEFKNITLIDSLPQIRLRSNGSAVGNQLKGYFLLQDIGQSTLYLDKSKAPFIYIETAAQKIFLNLATSEQTLKLYEALRIAGSP
jgi:hypothetical protein